MTASPALIRLREWLPAIVVFAIGILAWQWFLPEVLNVERYLLPPFWDVMSTFWNERDTLWSAGWFTFKEAVGGFLIGSGLAFVLALVLARWRPLGDALMPYAIAANAIPIIAFAPIANAWFGTLSPWSKIMIAAVLCFFPVFVNTLRGLTSVRPESLELMRSYAASETRGLPTRADSDEPAVRLLGLEGRVRACDDRSRRGRLLRRLHHGARRSDPELGRACAVRDGVGGDRRRQRARNRVLCDDRTRGAIRTEMASVIEITREGE